MWKFRIIIILFLFLFSVNAQVFNTASTLKSGKANLGINPAVLNEDFGLFLHGGYGISPGLDLGLKLGLAYPETYFGADIEWVLRGGSPYISVSAGGHSFGDVGLDGTLNFTFPINRQVNIYSGLDMDLNFVKVHDETETRLPFWLFFGTEIGFRTNMTIIIEVELGLNDDAYSIFGGGMNFYF